MAFVFVAWIPLCIGHLWTTWLAGELLFRGAFGYVTLVTRVGPKVLADTVLDSSLFCVFAKKTDLHFEVGAN